MVCGLLVAFVLAGISLCIWIYLQLNLSRADATVLAKRQELYKGDCGSWYQYLELSVNYSPSDTRVAEQAWIRADEGTWAQSKAGSRVEISYVPIPSLRQFALYHTKQLVEPLPPMSHVLDVQRSASAVVKNIHHVTHLGGRSKGHCSIEAWQPFDMVELSFVPEGNNEAVTALDSLDSASMANLSVGKPVTVTYFSSHPLTAKIVGASRDHKWKNGIEMLAIPVFLASLLLIGAVFSLRKWLARRRIH
jgi:hypothetical protein